MASMLASQAVDARVVLGDLAEDPGHETAGFAKHVGLLDEGDTLAVELLGVLEGLTTDALTTLLRLMMRVDRATFSSPLSFHLTILGLSQSRVVDLLRKREPLDAAVGTLGVLAEDHQVDIVASLVVQRVAGVGLAGTQVGVQVERIWRNFTIGLK